MNDSIINLLLSILTGLSYILILRVLMDIKLPLFSLRNLVAVGLVGGGLFMSFNMPFLQKMVLLVVMIVVTAIIVLGAELAAAVASGVMTYYIVALVDLFVGFMLVSVLNFNYADIRGNVGTWILTNLVIVAGSVLMALLPGIRHLFSENRLLPVNRQLAGIVSLASLIFLTLQIHFFRNLPPEYLGGVYQVAFLLQLVMFAALIFIVVMSNRSWMAERELAETSRILEKTNHHMEVVESMVTSNRKYRHDLKNALLGLSGLITEDNSEAKSFIAGMMDDNDSKASNSGFTNIENIQNRVLREIIYDKIAYAEDKGTSLKLAVLKPIGNLPVDMIVFSKIMGSLMDNAIEASAQHKKPVVFGYLEDSQAFTLTVINEIEGPTPSVDQIFREGYSTKGVDRGLGLSNVKEMVAAEPSLNLTTIIDRSQFIQELTVSK